MGTVYKETFTKPLPIGAEAFMRKGQRFARWKNTKGRTRTGRVTTGRGGQARVIVEASTYTAKYRDGSGVLRKVATGCKDETAARSILADLERRAVRVKAKILTAAEDAVLDSRAVLLAEHFDAYQSNLQSAGTSPVHRANVRRCLDRVAADCRFSTLSDLGRDALERWLALRGTKGMSARTRNCYRAAWVAFCNWCLATDRLIGNPFVKVPKADENADKRRKRRAMTEGELVKLLQVARARPLAEYGRLSIRKPAVDVKRKRDTWQVIPLTFDDLEAATERARQRLTKSPAVIARLERLGRERALIYKTLVLTVLRRGELASLTIGQLHLDRPHPYAELAAADEKNREGSQIALRRDLVDDLAAWIADTQERATSEPGERQGQHCLPMTGVPQPEMVPLSTPLFYVPRGLIRILDRDLKLAGILKRDERGRTLDVHLLRHSFGTLLSKGNVAPRTAQAAMRHSTIDLTMNTYTDPKLLDIHGALNALPALPLDGGPSAKRIAAKATGTDDSCSSPLVPTLVPAADKYRNSPSLGVKTADCPRGQKNRRGDDASVVRVKRNNPLTMAVNGLHPERAKGLEPSTSSLGSRR